MVIILSSKLATRKTRLFARTALQMILDTRAARHIYAHDPQVICFGQGMIEIP